MFFVRDSLNDQDRLQGSIAFTMKAIARVSARLTRAEPFRHDVRAFSMSEFNYKAAAELFPTRKRLPRRQPLGYKRFAHAADAIRFAIEDLSPDLLNGAFLEVEERRYDSDGIRRLYDSAEYPLARRGARS